LSLIASAPAWAANAVPNAGFENGVAGWSLSAPLGKPTLSPDKTRFHSGAGSARIDLAGAGDRAALYTYARPLQPGKRYTLSFWFAVKDFQVTADGSVKVALNFNEKGKGNGSAGNKAFALPIRAKDMDWTRFAVEVTAPGKAVVCQLCVLSIRGCSGAIWIDDVAMEDVADTARITQAGASPPLDGRLDAACWAKAAPLTPFYVSNRGAQPAATPTTALLSYDAKNLYVAFRNVEPRLDALKAAATTRDGPVYNDDCNEVFIAAPSGRAFQFILNSAGAQWDGELYARAEGDAYRADASWNGLWRGVASKGQGEWVAEFAIPFAILGGPPKDGETWRLNLARERHGYAEELTHWNCVEDNFNNVAKFACLRFDDKGATLTRFVDPPRAASLEITRDSPKYAELLSDQPGGYKVADWCHGYHLSHYPKSVREKYTDESFAREQGNFLSEHSQAGMMGPSLPWALKSDPERIMGLNKRNGMLFPLSLYSSAVWREAVKRGAQFVFRQQDFLRVDSADPVLQAVCCEAIQREIGRTTPSLISLIMGEDEPNNPTSRAFSRTLNPGAAKALDAVDAEIRKDFGAGRFGLYDFYGPKRDNDIEDGLARVAFWRWWHARYTAFLAQQQRLVKELAPGKDLMAVNPNYTGGVAPLSIALCEKYSDWVSCDPYPSGCMSNFGRERALYHTGFSARLVHDLSGGRPTLVMPQGFHYTGGPPTPGMIREWASQALKNGASFLMWYTAGPARFNIPDCYKEIIRVSSLITKMNRIKLPSETKTAILFSDYSMWGTGDRVAHGAYTLYTLLGERLGSWFRFVSDIGIELKVTTLDSTRLLYVPQLKFTSKAIAERLVDFVKCGGVVVVLDPRALTCGLDGAPLQARDDLIGGSLIQAREASCVAMCADRFGLANGAKLPLTPILHREGEGRVMACDIMPPADAKVFATYSDGKPAAFERRVGKGRVIYFGAEPFGGSSLALAPGAWEAFLRAMAAEVGEATNLDIWSFLLPEKGGEAQINYVVPPESSK